MIAQIVVPFVAVILMIVVRRVIVILMSVVLLGQLLLLLNRNRARFMRAQVGVVPKEVVHPLPGPCAKRLNGSTKVL
jgi:hypothetical protein